MNKTYLFLIVLCFSIFVQAAPKAQAVDCSKKIIPTSDDAMAVAFICSAPTTKKMKPLDKAMADDLNTILKQCSAKAGKAALHEQLVWLENFRNRISNYEDFSLQMESRSENLAIDADYAKKQKKNNEYGCHYFEVKAVELGL